MDPSEPLESDDLRRSIDAALQVIEAQGSPESDEAARVAIVNAIDRHGGWWRHLGCGRIAIVHATQGQYVVVASSTLGPAASAVCRCGSQDVAGGLFADGMERGAFAPPGRGVHQLGTSVDSGAPGHDGARGRGTC